MPMDDLTTLKHVPMFSSMADADLASVKAVMVRHNWVPGQTIIREGEPGDYFYIILNGRVYRGANGFAAEVGHWQFDPKGPMNVKRTFRRSAFLLSRLLSNMGVDASTPLLARFHWPVDAARSEQRWLEGLYLDTPEEWDDPYRFFRW